MHLRIAHNVVFRDLAGESVLLNLDSGTYFGLDAVGTRVWNLIAEQGSASLAIETLLAEYDVDAPRLEKDVTALIDRLLAKRLLTTDAEQTSSAR
ncbi:MAG: PqqD family protein [Nitrospira sp. LK265]|nr:PqqD family protein [Nitrospira sp.]NGZ59943.1 PqqD family protein [Nitrospira sp. LK265]